MAAKKRKKRLSLSSSSDDYKSQAQQERDALLQELHQEGRFTEQTQVQQGSQKDLQALHTDIDMDAAMADDDRKRKEEQETSDGDYMTKTAYEKEKDREVNAADVQESTEQMAAKTQKLKEERKKANEKMSDAA